MADEEQAKGVTVRVEGMTEALALLQKVAAQLPQEVDRLIEDEAEKVFAQSQRLVPVDTGTLQRSGSHKHSFQKSEVGYHTPYVVFVHDGTSKQEAQPFLRQAVEQTTPDMKSKAQELLEKAKA